MKESHFATYKQVPVHYTVSGTNGPAIFLLHGFLESHKMWNELLPQLTPKYKVICIDLLGHGQSGCVGYCHTMEEYAKAVDAVRKAENLRRVSLVGHSLGGYVSLAYVDLFPDNVREFCLFQSTSLPDDTQKKSDRLRAIDLVKRKKKLFVHSSLPLLFRQKFRSGLKPLITRLKEEADEHMTPRGIIAALEGMRQRPNRQFIIKFSPCPVHIVSGRWDKVVPIEQSRMEAESSEFATLYELKEAGHMGIFESPDEVKKVFREIF